MGVFDPSSTSTTPFNNIGSVLVVIPSGLGYFSSSAGNGIQPFDNLIFQINALRVKRTDWDNDGIINLFEGEVNSVNNEFIPTFFQQKTFNVVNFLGNQVSITQNMVFDLWGNNTDNDNFSNFIDQDDDGDDVLTRREIRYKIQTDPGPPPVFECKNPKWYNDLGVFQNEWTNIPRTPNDKPNPDKEVHLNNLYRNNADGNGTCDP